MSFMMLINSMVIFEVRVCMSAIVQTVKFSTV